MMRTYRVSPYPSFSLKRKTSRFSRQARNLKIHTLEKFPSHFDSPETYIFKRHAQIWDFHLFDNNVFMDLTCVNFIWFSYNFGRVFYGWPASLQKRKSLTAPRGGRGIVWSPEESQAGSVSQSVRRPNSSVAPQLHPDLDQKQSFNGHDEKVPG